MVETSSILILLVLISIIITVSFFIQEPSYKLAYFMIIGLGFLCLLNIYLTVFYYIKIRNSEGTPGPMGPKGNKGPKGEPGKCSFSQTCGISNPRTKIIDTASKMYDIPTKCIDKPNLATCNNEDVVAQAISIQKQVNILEDMAAKTSMAEQDFMDKLQICLSDPAACSSE
jgi:hypothetical protein